jgi:hypothetical protein
MIIENKEKSKRKKQNTGHRRQNSEWRIENNK